MAATVKEIMNPELFSARPTDWVGSVLQGILAFGVTAAPVLDDDGRPMGVVSLRDIVSGSRKGTIARARMSSPAAVVRECASVREAARLIGATGYRRLVVVDDGGRAVGMLSAIDVIRGLVGLPATHPAAFPHLDAATGLTWTDDAQLDANGLEAAPDGPGLLVLVDDAPGVPRRVVWVEAAEDLRARLMEMASLPQENTELAFWLKRGKGQRFRAAAVGDVERRERLVATLRVAAERDVRNLPQAGGSMF
jgi:hypothetical protein